MSNTIRQPLNILLVDDQPETVRVLNRFLRSMGHDVCSATTMHEAMELARLHNFDLLISDITLPDGTGLELMRWVNELRPTKGIAVSGYGADADIRNSQEAGFAAHIIKPTDLRRLLATIQQVTAG